MLGLIYYILARMMLRLVLQACLDICTANWQISIMRYVEIFTLSVQETVRRWWSCWILWSVWPHPRSRGQAWSPKTSPLSSAIWQREPVQWWGTSFNNMNWKCMIYSFTSSVLNVLNTNVTFEGNFVQCILISTWKVNSCAIYNWVLKDH